MKLKLLFILSIIIGLNGFVQTSSAQVSAESFKFTQLTNSSTQGVFASGSTVYVGTTSGLLISTDGGTTFTTKTITNGLGSNNVKNVFVDGSTIYAATDGGLSVSTNGGNNFVNYAPASFAYGNSMNDVFADGDTIYALASNRLWISNDAGVTFIEKTESDGIGSTIFREIVANGSDVYVATDGGLSISSDGGATFINKTNTDGLANEGANGVSFSNGVLYAASEGFDPVGGLSISTDKGNTFTVVQQADGLAANSVNTVYSEGVNVFVGVSSSVISVSNDGGATFTRYDYDDGIIGIVNQIFFDSGKIYVSTNQGIVFGEEAFPEIDIKGNNVSIVNGDTTPSTIDNTDFGVSVSAITKSFTIDNSEGFADLSLTTPYPNYVTISGSTDFTISTQPNANAVTKGSSKTFQVTYTPNLSGNQTAIISIANNDSDENPYTFTISGNKGAFSNYTTTFEPQTLNPNGLTSIGIFSNANFVDLDNDGDLDLMSGGRGTSFYYFENTGSDEAPMYAAVQNNPFGLTNIPRSSSGSSDSDSFPTFVDIDGDGDMDIVSGETYGSFYYYENTGTSSAPQYGTPIENPFGLTDDITFSSYPTFGDIDNDGDLDLLSGAARSSAGNPIFYYFENTGSSTAPQFSAPISNPFGLTLSSPYIRIQLGDLDLDGDLDLMGGDQYGKFLYFENIGTAQNPGYAASVTNPFGITNLNSASTPTLIDYDLDGDLDIMIGGSGGNFRYFQNGPTPTFPEIDVLGNNVSIVNGTTVTSAINNTNFGYAINPIEKTFTIDNSAGTEALVLNGNITISGSSDFSISTQTSSNSIAAGNSATFGVTYSPSSAGNQVATISISSNDEDESTYTFNVDGNLGSASGYTTTYAPVLLNPNGLIDIGIFSNANFADLDNDGDLDLLSGGRGTSFYYFENTGNDEAPAYAVVQNNPFGLTNVPRSGSGSSDSDSFPTLVDLDGDGDMDIVSGETYGSFYYYENTGTSSAPQYGTPMENPFGLTDDITFSSYPTFGDIDNDGDLDLLSGAARSSGGNSIFYYFENTGSSTAPQFSAPISNPFGLTLSIPYIRIQLGDLDLDGDLDLMGGTQNGEFLYFENIGTIENAGFATSISNPFGFSGMNSASTPTLIDYDNDGDIDIMSGGSGGNFRYYKNGVPPTFPEIDVLGNNISIANGDSTPNNSDNTNFGLSTGAITKTFTISNSGIGVLELTASSPNFITVSGSSDFTISAQPNTGTVASGNNLTFQVTYTPTLSETQIATISIPNNDEDESVYTFNVSGIRGVASNLDISFQPVITNPFGIDANVSYPFTEFVDLDDDGDLDLMAGTIQGSFFYFKNIGTASSPSYEAPVTNPFNLSSTGGSYASASFADLDGDGDLDLISGEYNQGADFFYYENIGTRSIPEFDVVQINPFGLTGTNSGYKAIFLDLDGDGDHDILTGDNSGTFHYFENIGDTTNPSFAEDQTNPFGLVRTYGSYSTPSVGDLDGDGDLDLLVGNSSRDHIYYENLGNANLPGFGGFQSNPFELSSVSSSYSSPVFADLDNDGDLDVLAADSGGNFYYYQNGESGESDYTQIPDAKFEQALIDRNIDSDGIINGRALTSDLEVVTQFAGTGLEIEDFTGLEAFRDLEVLNIYNNLITSIDLSGNGKLRELYAGNETNQLETILGSLDVSNNPLLEKLEVFNNNISTLDLSNNPLLTDIDVAGNKLTSLDVSNQIALLELNFASNAISTIDVSNNTALTFLQGNDNGLTTLDVSLNTNLTSLAVNQNPELGSFSTVANLGLEYLNIADTGISSVDVAVNTALTELFVGGNSLTSIDVSNNLLLKRLGVAFNQITNIDVSANNKLISFRAENNALVSLNIKNGANNLIPSTFIAFDIRNNPALECVLVDNATAATANWGAKDAGTTFSDTVCFSASDYTQIPDINFEKRLIALGYDSEGIEDGRALTSDLEVVTQFAGTGLGILDFTGLEAFRDLELLNIYNNLITSIDLSNNLNLKELYISNETVTEGQVLTSLDISSNVLLEKLVATNNQLTVLDVSNNPLLTVIDVSENELTSLDVSNQPNLLELDFATNQLTSIDVTNNTELTKLQGNDNDLTGAVDVSQNVALLNLSINNNANLGNMNVAANVNLVRLNLSKTGSTSVDVSLNTALEEFFVASNNFTSLDVSQNVALKQIGVAFNQLTELDLSTNSALTLIRAENNSLTSFNIQNGNNANVTQFDVRNNPALECILVDDENAVSNLLNKDATASFSSTVCFSSSDYTQIPDINFEKRLIALGYDSEGIEDGRALTSDLEVVTQFAGVGLGILDFTGLEAFRDLEVLNIYNNLITSIDLSGNGKLRELYAGNETNQLETILGSLDVSNNPLLEKLEVFNNNISTLDLSNNPLLTDIDVAGNKLTSLDVSNQIALLALNFAGNAISTIDVSNNTALTFLQGNDNILTSLDVSVNTNLTSLTVNSNPELGSFSVANNTDLTYLNIANTGISSVDVAVNTALTELFVGSNSLTSIDVSNNLLLKKLGVAFNQITNIDVSANNKLISFRAENNALVSLNIKNGANNLIPSTFIAFDIRNNPALECVLVDNATAATANWGAKDAGTTFSDTVCFSSSDYTQIPDINFEKRLIALGYDSEGIEDGRALTSDLEVVTQFAGTGLGILDFTGLEAFRDLEVLNIYNNLITSIDLSNNLKLKELYISNETVIDGQVLTSLDISNNVLLEKLAATNNKLTVLDVSNNPLLKVIDVSENELTSLDVSNQSNLLELDFATNQLTAIDVTNNTALTKLQGNDNDLTGAVDVSENIALLNLSINNNANLGNMNVAANVNLVRLNLSTTGSTMIDVSSNTALEEFFVSSNNFTSLDVSQNVELTELGASFNAIINIDVTNNTKLTSLLLSNNSIERAALKNGANNLITTFDIRNNPDLTCISVDDINFANTNWVNKDATASYNIDCSAEWSVYTTDANLSSAVVATPGVDNDGDGKVTYAEAQAFTGDLNFSGQNIAEITGLEAFTNAGSIDVSNNIITNINSLLSASSVVLVSKSTKQTKSLARAKNKVRKLNVSDNLISEIDISKLTDITELDAKNNRLTTLNLKNANNAILDKLDVTGNSNLSCIEVDNVADALAKADWKKDVTAAYNVSCKALSTEDFLKENVAAYPNPASSFVEILLSNGLELKKVEIFNATGKKITTAKDTLLNVGELSAGIYFIKVTTDKGAINKRIIKD